MDYRTRFKEAYLSQCSQLGVDPIQILLNDESGSGMIKLSGQTLASKGCQALAAGIRAGGTVHHVELCNAYINDEGCNILCESLLGTAIETLNLSRNNFGSDSAEAIAKVVRTCTNLKNLILNWNSVGSRCIPFNSMCEALAVSTSLNEIDLQNNKIGSDSTTGLCRLVEGSTTITHLNFGWNRIGSSGGVQISRSLETNNQLVFLQLAGNDIDYDTLVTIDDRIQSNSGRKRETEMSAIVLRQQREFQQALNDNANRLKTELDLRDTHVIAERQRSIQLSEQYEQLLADKDLLDTALKSRQKDLTTSSNEITALKDIIEAATTGAEEKLKQMTKTHKEELAIVTGKCAELQGNVEILETAKRGIEMNIELKSSEIEALTTTNNNLEDEKRTLLTDMQSYRSKEQEAQFKSKQFELTVDRLKQECDHYQSTIKNLQDRNKTLEDQFWEIERKNSTLESQTQQQQTEIDRKVNEVRSQCESDKHIESERSLRKIKELHDDVAHRDRLHEELKQDMLRIGERNQTAIDDIEERGKRTKELVIEKDLEIHRLTALASQFESEKRRFENELRSAESTRENLAREMENSSRQTQSELDRLTERFTADRMHLEMKVLQRDEKIQNLDSQNIDLSQRLKSLSDETAREKERLLKRVTEQVRVIFDESG